MMKIARFRTPEGTVHYGLLPWELTSPKEVTTAQVIEGDLFGRYRPRAGSIAFPKLLRGKVDEFCADLIEKAGVLLLPGTLYGDRYNSFRIGFGRKNLPEALEKLEAYLQASR